MRVKLHFTRPGPATLPKPWYEPAQTSTAETTVSGHHYIELPLQRSLKLYSELAQMSIAEIAGT
jgi:hypothetical protein